MEFVALVALAAVFGYLLRDQSKRHDAERQILLNRIQAPQVAIAQTTDPGEPAQTVRFDDDDAFWEAVNDGAS